MIEHAKSLMLYELIINCTHALSPPRFQVLEPEWASHPYGNLKLCDVHVGFDVTFR